jgi:hypothetical protein
VSLAIPSAAHAASQAWQMTLTARGYGHAVGMSQYGAYGYAPGPQLLSGEPGAGGIQRQRQQVGAAQPHQP